ncbi:hypothetical protein QBC34DRAFT_108510 [Podospora aff. communis PSN243]|uniref:Uncharacterized protein n=1 Tax=Podospora aff. communis PSN243 TaxID=3040156 RepID=A0AAV9H7V6_9PEZI|nr:hypothetical protein QBC34DRAFT_108510 [Podospora aff. communis PSN243]
MPSTNKETPNPISSPAMGPRGHLSVKVRDGVATFTNSTCVRLAPTASSAAQGTPSPSIRERLRPSAHSGRQPQAKRQAGTTEGQNSSAANEGPEPITPPLPLQDARAVAPKDARARFDLVVLDGSSGEPVERSDRVGTATRPHLADNACALEHSLVFFVAELEEMDLSRQCREPGLSSRHWNCKGHKVSEAVDDVREIESADSGPPARMVETKGGDGWILVSGADDWEVIVKPTETLSRTFRTCTQKCCVEGAGGRK